MGYPFGQDISYTFTPIVDGEVALNLPSQTPTIYVFSDSDSPDRTQAAAGTNSIQTISSWTQIGSSYQFTISAVEDPDTDSLLSERLFWLGINFVLKSAGQTQTVVKGLPMERVGGHYKQISVTVDDVKDVFPAIKDFAADAQIKSFLELAKQEIRAQMRAKEYAWALVTRADRLNLPAIYRTLTHLMGSQRMQSGDIFDVNYNSFNSSYSSLMKMISVEYDADQDGIADTKTVNAGRVFLTR